uniref:Uncharacterized protein n=1 Tax=Anguilla anguilla TaxID=7936 RepID=A0A0E9V5R7_ANGAN
MLLVKCLYLKCLRADWK